MQYIARQADEAKFSARSTVLSTHQQGGHVNILLHTAIAGFVVAFIFGAALALFITGRWYDRLLMAPVLGFTSMVILEAIRLALKGAL